MATYPPGSVFKLVNELVALQLGVVTPNTGFRVQPEAGALHPPPRATRERKHCHQESCNPYFYQVMQAAVLREQAPNKYEDARIGLGQWQKMVKSFGLGEKLGVDMAQEKRGLIPSPEYYDKILRKSATTRRWRYRNVYSLSIGQGEIGITGLQMANVMATIANRGWYYTPHFVRGIGNGGPLPQFQREALHGRRYRPVQVHHSRHAGGSGWPRRHRRVGLPGPVRHLGGRQNRHRAKPPRLRPRHLRRLCSGQRPQDCHCRVHRELAASAAPPPPRLPAS